MLICPQVQIQYSQLHQLRAIVHYRDKQVTVECVTVHVPWGLDEVDVPHVLTADQQNAEGEIEMVRNNEFLLQCQC